MVLSAGHITEVNTGTCKESGTTGQSITGIWQQLRAVDEYWELSVRFNYAGGAPYTTFNFTESVQHGNGIYDIESLQAHRLPDYKNLSFRIDRRFYFSGANLIAYIYMWNVFNRRNPAYYGWSAGSDIPVTYKQFDRITAFGIEFEF